MAIVERIKALGIEGAVHVTAVEASRDDIARHCELVLSRGIENLVTIRGDVPKAASFSPPRDGFRYAVDLIRFIRECAHPLCLIGGGHPEGHPECRDLDVSVRHLKEKVDAGLDAVITQLFYDNACYRLRRARAAARRRRPAGRRDHADHQRAPIQRITQLSGNAVPPALAEGLERRRRSRGRAGARRRVRHATVRRAAACRRAGIHFYTLNQSPATRAIFQNLRREGLV